MSIFISLTLPSAILAMHQEEESNAEKVAANSEVEPCDAALDAFISLFHDQVSYATLNVFSSASDHSIFFSVLSLDYWKCMLGAPLRKLFQTYSRSELVYLHSSFKNSSFRQLCSALACLYSAPTLILEKFVPEVKGARMPDFGSDGLGGFLNALETDESNWTTLKEITKDVRHNLLYVVGIGIRQTYAEGLEILNHLVTSYPKLPLALSVKIFEYDAQIAKDITRALNETYRIKKINEDQKNADYKQ